MGGVSAAVPFLATAAARKVHADVMARLTAHAATPQGRDALRRSLAPLPTPAEAEAAAHAVMRDRDLVAPLDRDRVRGLLARLAPAPEPAPRQQPDRLVVCATEELRESWEARGLHRHVRLSGPEGLRQGEAYSLVVVLGEAPGGADAEPVVGLPEGAGLAEVAPEAALAWFAARRPALVAAAELSALLVRPSAAPQALALLDGAARPAPTPVALRRAVAEVRRELDALLRGRTAGLTVSGADVLASLGGGLPPAIQKAVDEVLAEGGRRLRARTGCALQPFLPGIPVQVDEEAVGEAERGLEARGHADLFLRLGAAAQRLDALRPALERELEAWRAFEPRFALGAFALDNGLRPARFGAGLRFGSSVHLALAADGRAQRIAYRLGPDEPVALLTGANSGGKTTLLEHLLQLTLMARLGLPVVGEGVEVPWVDEIHLVTARRSLDAGAFESFLKSFLPVALGGPRRLVLADEVEAVTEAEAAARILGCVLDRLHGSGSLGVVVSHMAPQVLLHTAAPVRIDGIEATGLDARNRLVVDRNPRIGRLARSTPELIVQRLAAAAPEPARGLYADLLQRLQAPRAPGPAKPARPPPRASHRRLQAWAPPGQTP